MALYHKIWCIIIEKLTILFDERLKQSEDDTLETGFGRADVGQLIPNIFIFKLQKVQ